MLIFIQTYSSQKIFGQTRVAPLDLWRGGGKKIDQTWKKNILIFVVYISFHSIKKQLLMCQQMYF